ncbi:maleylpyruvate isomerase family mycothiol-dependent enzyme [Rugosimonospora acidiphila]|uniref:Maleylpyruvate isomerase family mycothiol-dependent enzyme n=2 Tax=Rugosimonospora acidiphila TaxID=556531 RepID=A0ABP9SML4_9ACTN
MRQQRFPEPWPPDIAGEDSLELLDRAYQGLTEEFAARAPGAPAVTWYEPEQTVGFWIRRMAQETVMHRVDAELAVAGEVSEIPEELAVDGIDEVLERFLVYGSHRWTEDFAPVLPERDQPPVLVATDGYGWLVRATPDGATIDIATPRTTAPASVCGDPVPLLLWLWRRADDGVEVEGDQGIIDELRALLCAATQ